MFTGFVQFVASEDCWIDAGNKDRADDEEQDDEEACHMSFHDAMYFSFVTFSTVGYGDIAPRGTQGRILTLTMIGCVWTVLPAELTKFSRLLDLRSKYSGSYKPKSTNHIIISCNVGSVQSVADFLKSFFQDDYGVRPTPVVVVVPSEPDEEWNKLLVKYNIQGRIRHVTYLKGDIINQQDLLRARADLAVACFILSDMQTSDSYASDSHVFLRTLSIKSFNDATRLYVQVIEVEHRQKLISIGIDSRCIISIKYLQSKLLAYACDARDPPSR